MSEERRYVRLYLSILDDPKFESIYGDDAAWAAYTRLLMLADSIWPASAPIPKSCKPGAFRKLVDALIVDAQPGGMFRIHGLDAERERRREAAVRSATAGSTKRANAQRTLSERSADAVLAEQSKAEQSKAESDPDAVDAYYYLTARMPRGRALDWCKRLGDEYGQQRASAAMSAAWSESDDISTLLSRTEDALARWRHDEERRERAAELARLAEKRQRRVVEAREVPSAATPEEVEAAIERYRQETSHDAA